MPIKEFISNLEKSGFTLEMNKDKLVLKAYKNKLSREQIEAVKTNKEIIDFIKGHRNELIEYISGLQQKKITKQQRPEFIPLSFNQERLWFIDRFEGSIQYHIPSVLVLKGKLNKKALIYSIKSIIERHEVLRTVIKDRDGVPYQQIKESKEWELEIIDGKKIQDNLDKHIYSLINTVYFIRGLYAQGTFDRIIRRGKSSGINTASYCIRRMVNFNYSKRGCGIIPCL